MHDLAAAFVFYGAFEHTRDELTKIKAPVYGFYGGNDERINATLPATEAAMKELGKTFEPVIYEGAGHGFFAVDKPAYRPVQATDAWQKVFAWYEKYLRSAS